MGLINNTVKLENDYDTWKRMFEEEKSILNSIFNNSFEIEHVGSTSVKGLAAKPIVDIAIGVNSLDELNQYMAKLKERYTIKENLNYKELLLIKETKNETFFLIHVLLKNDIRYQNMIKFRDILINDSKVLKEYEQLKQDLAKKYQNNRELYTKSKNDFIERVLKSTNN
jgi:GrpB-like predicted nucleotidyltransferase (UPF0157 family)